MSGPVPSPSMNGMIGRSGTSRRPSPPSWLCQAISCPSVGGVVLLRCVATFPLLRMYGEVDRKDESVPAASASSGTVRYHTTAARSPCYIAAMDWEALVAAAAAARANAYAPYSGFAVGAALLMEDGSIHAAGNVENCIPALSICAERNAVAMAVLAGQRRPVALAVVTGATPPARPCGLCRQTLVEFTADLPILVVNAAGEREETTLAEIFPQPFTLPG